jgi:phosphate uptake regulator
MKRKIIKFGESSHVISLPRDWMESEGLEKGDYIVIERNADSSLNVRSDEKKTRERAIEIEYPGEDEVFTMVVSAYVNGYTNIIVNAKKEGSFGEKDLTAMRDAVNLISGVEIVSESPTRVEYECYIHALDRDIRRELQRMLSLTSDMLSDALNFLHDRDGIRTQVVQRDKIINRIDLFVKRQVKDKLICPHGDKQSPTVFVDKHRISQTTERIGDYIVDIAKVVHIMNVNLTADELKLLRTEGDVVLDFLKKTQYAFVQRNRNEAMKLLSSYPGMRKDIRSRLWDIGDKVDGKNGLAVYTILFFLYRILSLTKEIDKAIVDISVAETGEG